MGGLHTLGVGEYHPPSPAFLPPRPVGGDPYLRRTRIAACQRNGSRRLDRPRCRLHRHSRRVSGADVAGGSTIAELDDGLIEVVMGRLDETSGFSAELRALLSMMPSRGSARAARTACLRHRSH